MAGKRAVLRVPRGGEGGGEFELPLDEVYRLDARRAELDDLNSSNVKVLRRVFSDGAYKVGRLRLVVRKELNRAEARLLARKKVVLVDESKALLAAAGHEKSSEDLRKMIVAADPQVLKIQDTIDEIKLRDALLELQREQFERAYFSCMKYDEPRLGLPKELLSHNVGAVGPDPVHGDDRMPAWADGKPPAGGSLADQFAA